MNDKRKFQDERCSLQCEYLFQSSNFMNTAHCQRYNAPLVHTNFYPIRCEKCRDELIGAPIKPIWE
jgi:hypothetical protein